MKSAPENSSPAQDADYERVLGAVMDALWLAHDDDEDLPDLDMHDAAALATVATKAAWRVLGLRQIDGSGAGGSMGE